MIEVTCCTEKIQIPEDSIGKKVRCPACGRVIQLVSAEKLFPSASGGDFDAALELIDGPQAAASRYFLGGVADIHIGKLAACQITLPGERISRDHCRLVRLDFGPPRWKIVDQSSTNGVIVDGTRITEHTLSDGDFIQIGEYSFRYTLIGWAEQPTAPSYPSESYRSPAYKEPITAIAPSPALATPVYAPDDAPPGNAMAIAGLILGILMCVPPCSLVAIVFSIIGIRRAKKRHGSGMALALAGLILGSIGTLTFLPFTTVVFVTAFHRAFETAHRAACVTNLKNVGNALSAYASANNGQFPPSLDTLVSAGMLQPSDIVCPDAPGETTNYVLSASSINVPPTAIVVYEPLSNHGDGINVLYRNGQIFYLNQVTAQTTIASLQNGSNPPGATMPRPFFNPPVLRPTFPQPGFFPSHPANFPPGNFSSGNFSPGNAPQPTPTYSDQIPPGATQTEMIGGNGGGPYVRVDPLKRRTLGFAIKVGSWTGHPTISHIDPLFTRFTANLPPDEKAYLAPMGYAVGGINVNKLNGADGVQIIYMRIRGNAVDPTDSYTSDWIGDSDPAATTTKLAANGDRVIGTFGRQGLNNDAIGLVTESAATKTP
jgi:hypothetical protein